MDAQQVFQPHGRSSELAAFRVEVLEQITPFLPEGRFINQLQSLFAPPRFA
jgi:hypothetical protein